MQKVLQHLILAIMKKVLLDENLPKPLKKHFSKNVEVTSVPDLKWQSLKNGELLKAVEKEGIDILITADRNLKYQQNLNKLPIQIVVLIMFDNRYKPLIQYVPIIEEKLLNMKPTDKIIEIDLRDRSRVN